VVQIHARPAAMMSLNSGMAVEWCGKIMKGGNMAPMRLLAHMALM
jgi:hypothetical protein